MTKSRTRKSPTPKKQAEAPQAEQPKAMDPGAPEQTTPRPQSTSHRDAYALTTLVNEVTSLFPEVTHETGNPNAFNTRLSVFFHDAETPDLYPLLALVESDPRVLSVDRDSAENYSMVELHNSFRTQDSRAPFGLADAHAILTDGGRLALDDNHDFVIENDEDPDEEPTMQGAYDSSTRTEPVT